MILEEYYEVRNIMGYKLNQHYLTDGKNTYFFKGITNDNEIIKLVKELLVSEILDLINIYHIKSKYYVWEGIRGLISPNFFDINYEVLSCIDLLSGYESSLNKPQEACIEYSLQSIFKGMEYYFKTYPNFKQQIKTFMENLIDMCLFDYLISNSDCNSTNVNILFDSKSFFLGPIFDYGLSFDSNMTSVLNTKGTTIPNSVALKSLLDEQGMPILLRMQELLRKVTPNIVSKLLKKVLKTNNITIDEKNKAEILRNFCNNYATIFRVAYDYQSIEEASNVLVKR